MKSYLIMMMGCLLASGYLAAQRPAGTWMGKLKVQGMELPLVLHLQENDGKLKATMDSPAQGAKGLAVDTVTLQSDSLRVVINRIGMRYTGAFISPDSIAGLFYQMGARLPLSFIRTRDSAFAYKRLQQPQPPFPYAVDSVTLQNATQGLTLAGTFTRPSDCKDCPVVVFITGSGAQDRDETLFGHRPFWVMADYFARHGIASLRLDDRGVGGSGGDFSAATTADFATDINAAVNWLADKGHTNIGLVGHSEGGMIAPMVAVDNKKVKYIVLLAGPGVKGGDLLESQVAALSRVAGAPEADINKAVAATRQRNALLLAPDDDSLENRMEQLLKQQLAAGAGGSRNDSTLLKQQLRALTSPWYRYFIRFNPDAYLSKLQVPVLALNGTLDLQVPATANLAGIRSSLEKAGNQKAEFHSLKGLNHLFQPAVTGAISEYANIETTVAPEVLKLMTDWILKTAKTEK